MVRAPALLLVLLALGLAAGCRGEGGEKTEPRPTPPAKKRLILASNSEPDVLNPLFAEMAAAREIIFLVQRELTMFNERWELVPDLAVEIPTMENGLVRLLGGGEPGPDGQLRPRMEVTWHIRPDAVWEDGTPVTADDYIFAWEVQSDPNQEIINRDLPERIAKMEARGEDRKTLVVTWKEPFAFYHQFRVHYALPKHALVARYRRAGGGTEDMKKDPYGQRPLSNGPFKLQQWKPGEYISLVRNDRYPTPARLDEITIRFIPDDHAMESALLAGDIDGVTPMGGFSVAQVEQLRKNHGDRFTYYSVPGLVWAHIDFNLDSPILADKRVRHAIAYAIDRKSIIEQLFYDRYTLSHTFLPPRHWGYHPSVVTYPYEPEKAKALLDEAGWKQKEEGAIRTKGKKKLTLKISAVAGVKDVEDLEQVLQSDLKNAGIELLIENKPSKVFFGEFGRYRRFPHLSFYSWVMDPTLWGNTMWQSDQIPSEQNSWNGQNYPGWVNEEATALLREVPSVLDPQKRREMMHRVQELWAEDLPALPMYFRPVVAVTSPRVKNYQPTGTRTPMSWNAHEWDLVDEPTAAAP